MLELLKQEANMTLTANGAAAYKSTLSGCLDLFSEIGLLRHRCEADITALFQRAYAENPDIAMKILFFGRDVRGGLGSRKAFRVIINWLAQNHKASIAKNISLIPEYGRYDDLLSLLQTDCKSHVIELIRKQLAYDLQEENTPSLLAKWLPSINASNKETVLAGKSIARDLGLSEMQYRKTLSYLRGRIRILENNLRQKDYTFDYSKQPSKAMLKYRAAFLRNDQKRYNEYLNAVAEGNAKINTGTLLPHEVIAPFFTGCSDEEKRSIDVVWNALEDFTRGENAIVVADGSGSMYGGGKPSPITVALSLAIYFAERNNGAFKNHFITFSQNPRLVEIKGKDIFEKVRYCASYNEVANTDIQKVFELILNTAVKNNVKQSDLPERIYIISDMEFDCCAEGSSVTNFHYARKLFESHGYKLPQVVFWNVCGRTCHHPVTMSESGAALVSGYSPRLFSMLSQGELSPMNVMMDILSSPRYSPVCA